MKLARKLRQVGPASVGITIPSSFTSLIPWMKDGQDVNLIIEINQASGKLTVVMEEKTDE